MTLDVPVQPKEEAVEDISSVHPVHLSLPFVTLEVFLMVWKEEVGAAGSTILLGAGDVRAQNVEAIADIAVRQLAARSDTASSKRVRQQPGCKLHMPTLAVLTLSNERNLLARDIASTSVVSTPNATRLAIGEATSGELLDDAHLQKEIRHLMPKNARCLALKQTAEREESRLKVQQEEKQRETTMAEASLLNLPKTPEKEIRDLMGQCISGGLLHLARANPVEEAKLALS